MENHKYHDKLNGIMPFKLKAVPLSSSMKMSRKLLHNVTLSSGLKIVTKCNNGQGLEIGKSVA